MRDLPRSSRNPVSQSLASMLSFGLCMYFAFHLLHGDRGYFALRGIEQRAALLQQKHDQLQAARAALESRVRLLRPESLDPDLLDERARAVLGWVRPEERVIPENAGKD